MRSGASLSGLEKLSRNMRGMIARPKRAAASRRLRSRRLDDIIPSAGRHLYPMLNSLADGRGLLQAGTIADLAGRRISNRLRTILNRRTRRHANHP